MKTAGQFPKPKIETPVAAPQSAFGGSNDVMKQSPTSDKTQKIEESPLPVPEIDADAALKIDEAEIMAEEIPQQKKNGNLLFIIGSIVGIIIIAGVVTLSILYFKAPEKSIITETTPTPTLTVTDAPKIELIKSNFNFEVLNASGITGQAGKTKTLIEAEGYIVSTVGNANSQETGTKLLLKESLVNQKDLLVSDLQKILPELIYSGEFDSDTVNARIIIGE